MDALKSKGQMYDQIDLGKISRSGFDLSWNNKGTGKIGRIIPTRCTEVLPGDRFKGSSAAAVQFEPLAVPILANMDVRQEHFYVPNNILWRNWDKFITGGENLDDTSVLPSTSLYVIMMALFYYEYIFPAFQLVPYWTKAETSYLTPKGWLVEFMYSSKFDDMRTQLTKFGNRFGCVDLLAPSFKVIDELESLYSWSSYTLDELSNVYSYKGKDGSILQGRPILHNLEDNQFLDVTLDAYSRYESSSNMYLRNIVPAMKLFKSNGGYINPVGVWTDDGARIIELMYQYYRIFLGEGSNLDYLNMHCVTLQDFYLLMTLSIPMNSKKDDGYDIYSSLGSFDENVFSKEVMSVLPLRANYAIWYNYYRDQLLETLPLAPNDGDTISNEELITLLLPRQRCWAKDTFTTALANTGTGSMIVPIDHSGSPFESATKMVVTGVGKNDLEDMTMNKYELSDGSKVDLPTRFLSGMHAAISDQASNYYGFSLDMLNRAQRAQKWLQKALIYGNRIQDRLFTSFGVKFLDNRLRIPEYLSGSRQLVQLSVNTNPTTVVTDKSSTIAGDKSANAYAYDKGDGFNRFCEEHGFIISYLTIMPEATYAYGAARMYSKLDKFDYAWPEFSTLGMDAVYTKELATSSFNVGLSFARQVFGYQGRYYDYKCKQDEEHGELPTTQNMYTFSRQFDLLNEEDIPKLNYVFVHCWPSLDMFVVDSPFADYFRYDIHHSVAAERPLPVCGMYL